MVNLISSSLVLVQPTFLVKCHQGTAMVHVQNIKTLVALRCNEVPPFAERSRPHGDEPATSGWKGVHQGMVI